ncbi:hypothetical protein [Arthrobacter sp. Br18]|uniref:hypothetical protein n=1 Tax=Arthrobacter sp. Br18 TaxID=1312954 RepID=UPI00047AF1D4|nr:hypothetical protein [Arthrobacter sp. Br18]
MNAETGQALRAVRNHEPSLWFRQQVQQVASNITAGDVHHCGHLALINQPVIAALWDPHLVVCEACEPLRLRLTGDADNACDRCGHIDPRGVYPGGVRFTRPGGQILVVLFGFCDTCARKEGINA